MRRAFAASLLLLLFSQSSGAALAGTGSSVKLLNLGTLIAPVQSAIVGSWLYAFLTGTTAHYDVVHAFAPQVQRPAHSIDGLAIMRSRRALRPRARHGTPEALRLPPRQELTSRERRRDPRAMRRSTVTPHAVSGENGPVAPGFQVLRSAQSSSASTPSRLLSARPSGVGHGKGVKQALVANPGTGVEHWWTYEEQPIPGIGKALLNVATGNLLVSAMDVDVPEQGINLTFQRVYNSQSLHDINGDDGGEPAIFGNGWTNDFDANIVYNATSNTITVYDLNGTACTYTSNGDGGWVPCTGEYAVLAPDQSNSCLYTWTKPSGTVYVFDFSNGSGLCSAQNLTGHLVEIISRNSNNYITFTYSWDSSGLKTSEHITQIVATHSDGDQLVMTFGLVAGSAGNYNELATITRPDGAQLQYWYDQNYNLVEVDKPGNNSAANIVPLLPSSHTCQGCFPQGDLPETYVYNTGTSQMEEACGPRCTAYAWGEPTPEGASLVFQYTTSSLLSLWEVQGVLNFTPDDQTGTVLNGSAENAVGWQTWDLTQFQYASSGNCTTSGVSGATYLCDSDGHKTTWFTDSIGRVTETDRFAPTKIPTTQEWDSSNNLVSTTDANKNTTKYGYDGSGNMVEMQQPSASDFMIGTGQNQPLAPLSFYSYDSNNNVVAYCDPVFNSGKPWAAPTDNLCPTGTQGAAYFVYDYDQTNEPYGCLTDMYKPLGYHTKIKYTNADASNCGDGLPSLVQGDAIPQILNRPTRQPTQDFTYNQWGQLQNYDRGQDTQQSQYDYDSWTLSYNQNGSSDNLNTERTENDPTIGTAMNSFTCYYPDGSVFYTQTPSQYAAGKQPCPTTKSLLSGSLTVPAEGTIHYYNFDGDEVKVVGYKGCTTNSCPSTSDTQCTSTEGAQLIDTTCKYYDGLDRLVETTEPYDNRNFSDGKAYEFYGFRWMNRYIYDLTLSGAAQLSISDQTGGTQTFAAYGNLYKTEERLPQGNTSMRGCYAATAVSCKNAGPYSSGSWSDVRGTSFDALDRPVNKYELAFGPGGGATVVPVTSNTYDATGQLGELSSVENAVQQTTTYTYDQIARVENVKFAGAGDNRSYQYDQDGRTAALKGASFGQISYTYDDDGNETSVTEPTPNNYSSGSLICYSYYPDGLREYVGIGVASQDSCGQYANGMPAGNPTGGGIEQPQIFSYAYSGDGRLLEQDVNWGYWSATGTAGIPAQFKWTYAPSGRENTETDPLTEKNAFPAYSSSGPTQIVAKSYTYDQFGRVAGLTLPGQYQESPPSGDTSLAYDEDDELMGFNAVDAAQTPLTRSMALNARGELLEDGWGSSGGGNGTAQAETQSANGTQVGMGDSVPAGGPLQVPPTTIEYDLRSGMVTCSTDPTFAQDYNSPSPIYPWVIVNDAAGRKTNDGYDTSGQAGQTDTTCNSSAKGLSLNTYTYDAENHLLTSSRPSDTSSATWGPDGRQRISQDSLSGTETAHWDGDTLLFATSGTASPSPVLYIGKFATMDSAGDINVYDRDQTGARVSSHGFFVNWNTQSPEMNWMKKNGYWIDAWGIGSVRTLKVVKSGQQMTLEMFPGTCNGDFSDQGKQVYVSCPATLAQFEMTRADGYTMVGGIVQGARTYDPTSGQWLTPDAYAGDVNDPMSQKPFMWNENNPDAFSDPTGYDPLSEGSDGGGAQGQNDPAPGEPGSACAATDSSGKCYQENEAIPPPNGTKTNGYGSLTDAAYAAKEAYSFIKTAGEVGCEVYCNGGSCGFGEAGVAREDPGGTSNGPAIFDDGAGSTASQIGTWHSHPGDASPDDTENHNAFAQRALGYDLRASEASVFTSEQGSPMQIQTYTRATQWETVEPSNAPPPSWGSGTP